MAADTTDHPRTPLSPIVVRLLLALLCLIWGSTWIVIKGGLQDLPPFTSAGIRFLIAALVMIPLAAALHRREGGRRPPTWMWLVQGAMNFAIPYGLVYHAETVLPSGLVSLLWGVYPMLQALAGNWFLKGERLVPAQWLGFGLGLVGLTLLFQTDIRGFGADGVPTAALLMLSPAAAVIGLTLVKRHGGGVSSTLLNRNGMAFGAGLLIAFALVFERDAPTTWTAPAIASVVYLAVVGTVVTFSLYFWLLRYAPAHRLGLIAYVTPAIALMLGWTIGREAITPFTLAGAGLILGGVLLVAKRRG